MNILSSLPKIVAKKYRRLGRGVGSGAGAKSGRGTTRHQKARTSIPLAFEGGQNRLTKKFPLLRGKGRNKPTSERPLLVHLDKLNRLKKNSIVNVKELINSGIVNKKALKVGIKIVARGKLDVPLQVAAKTSQKAREMIEKAGGKIVQI
ncbi:50S ribosomal protein L15 [Candidatus Roizmanbacteria bacterium RIFCSPLOWO2_02_FULL_37_19]|uniref:Large ribosomal subunit protein uL15 n=1 Tax=Candidatus Roizmanbacteria bacterium RIFCSPHIGHO2_02_FULL_37_24 TaxID=1802037 RepID=A0A1F7GVP5_9BACT|nr:MAG: 50S ribosomal protein L15 [Candidatus Roizmanbacteria bacterium RIFCSPHIGHO2_02_FULL_37_24]OGK33425.1 MAG: 50S ribosomal protein L15 [Candidatus Roizmanbacteria bacterium RIFCSPHIGHO2_12_FULL_37_23]OGK54434.1 MAG: 50S ribosomal protein L15 [Candidatus Roizmanbacteria bacterium RIFCSPLOWO2_02_FULL_37_19]OGK59022.1 MAG: 50S ribosomal protein L15 [Candidatus Roizmanbacteria bacterium RIFCSPLOWO2_12_FULL_37_7b]